MQDPDPVERQEAAADVARLRCQGFRATSAVRPLIRLLDDADQRVREAAARALLFFRDDAQPAMPVVMEILRSNRADLWASAIRLLGSIGSEEACALLSGFLNDPGPERRLKTVQALHDSEFHGPSLFPLLRERFKIDTDPTVRASIYHFLVKFDGDPKQVVIADLQACRDEGAELRREALSRLSRHNPELFLHIFQRGVGDEIAGVREAALHALCVTGLEHPDAIPLLCQSLKNPLTHDAAVKEIGGCSVRFISSGSGRIPEAYAFALDAAVEAVREAMDRDDPQANRVVVPLLFQLLGVAEFGNVAGSRIVHAAVDSLRAKLRLGDPVLRRYVLVSLLDRIPTEVLGPVLDDLLEKENAPEVGVQARTSLSAGRSDIASLIATARARDRGIRFNGSLINLLPEGIIQSLIPKICTALADPDENLRLQALIVISILWSDEKSRPKPTSAGTRCIVSALRAALTDRVSKIREFAATVLGELGPAAKDSEPDLHDAIAKGQEPRVLSRMEAALRRIGGNGPGRVEPQ